MCRKCFLLGLLLAAAASAGAYARTAGAAPAASAAAAHGIAEPDPAGIRATAAAPDPAVRKAFQLAWNRAAGTTDTEDSAALKAYVLYPYLQAERIHQQLQGTPEAAAAADRAAAEFLTVHAGTPVAVFLRRAWLESLAQRQSWAEFLNAYRDADATDALRCQSFQARIATGKTEGLTAEVTRLWLSARIPQECDAPFTALLGSGVLSPELVERRIRVVLDGPSPALARALIDRLTADRAAPWLQWVRLAENPQAGIDTVIAAPAQPVPAEAVLAAWKRLTRTDVSAATDRYARLVRALDLAPQAASPYALALALGLAWNRDPAALGYFDQVAAADMDDAAQEWRARAALWSQNWALAAKAIDALSPTDRQSTRWRYWSARIAQHQGDATGSLQLYESVLADDNYYSALAAARLHRRAIPHQQSLPEDDAIVQAIARHPAFVRARELFLCDLKEQALAELQYGNESLPAAERPQVVHLAAQWGWFSESVLLASSLKVYNDYDLLYPQPFEQEVIAAAHRARLSPDLVYGVLRQESLYRPDALSGAGARGLMQLEPSTAQSTARSLRRAAPTPEQLFEPALNTTLGAAHLRMLLDAFNEQVPAALAGYNAGPNAVVRW
ncbi:MAG TPA: transglycosylase SLT domain-containing protein, partial [Steroidobacteraceae bacterium]|nr:transglycosylase SLT domain-containing protein [Steroidobacteraceae bacterium]